MNWDTTVNVDLDEVKEFIESDKFVGFLLNNTTNFGVAAFVLQTVYDAIEQYKNN